MNLPTAAPGRHLVLWDGECGFCRRFAGWLKEHDPDDRFEPEPYQQIPSPPMLREACAQALHVVTDRGELLRGADAVLFVYEQLGWRAAGWARRSPLLPVLELGYRWVAANRRFVSRWLFRRERPAS